MTAMMYHSSGQEPPVDGAGQPLPASVSSMSHSSGLPASAGLPETTAPNGVSADELAKAIELVERKQTRGKITRRVLVGVAAAGLCAGAVEFGPAALNKAGEYTKAQLEDAFQAGIENGRQALLNELVQLEGVTLEGAIGVAKLTQLGIKYLVVPLAKLTTTIEGDALQVLVDAVSSARTNLAHFNVTVGWLDSLQTLLSTWRDNVVLLPQSLDTYASADVGGAETYLEALQTKIRAEQSAQATPSPTQ
jgi:hypothetical protein